MEKIIYDVEIFDLVKSYKELVALDNLSLSIRQGEIFGLLGPNGSGKSTLINCILALLKYDQGEVKIFGQEMKANSYEIKRAIGLVPQEISVYDELTVWENIDYFTGLYLEDKKLLKQRVAEAIDFVQLNDFRDFRPKKLSGGLLRRLNLACGIAHKPRLIFLDEPTVAVDPQSRNRLLEGIKQLQAEGCTIIYTTHYMEEAEYLCDRIAILDHGKVIALGKSEEIISLSKISETIKLEINNLPEAVLIKIEADLQPDFIRYENPLLQLAIKQENGSLFSLLDILSKAGFTPFSVQSKKSNLNDVFLELTGKELRDHD